MQIQNVNAQNHNVTLEYKQTQMRPDSQQLECKTRQNVASTTQSRPDSRDIVIKESTQASPDASKFRQTNQSMTNKDNLASHANREENLSFHVSRQSTNSLTLVNEDDKVTSPDTKTNESNNTQTQQSTSQEKQKSFLQNIKLQI